MDCIQIPMSFNSIGSDLAFTLITSSLKRCYIHTHAQICTTESFVSEWVCMKATTIETQENLSNDVEQCMKHNKILFTAIYKKFHFIWLSGVCVFAVYSQYFLFSLLFSFHLSIVSFSALHFTSSRLILSAKAFHFTQLTGDNEHSHTNRSLSLSLSGSYTCDLLCTFLLVFCHFAFSFGLFHLFYWIFVCNK